MATRTIIVASDDPMADGATREINVGGRPAKGHNGRQRKLACGSCAFACYTSARAVREHGAPEHCGSPMSWANARDILALASAEDLAAMAPADYRALCAEAGEPTGEPRPSVSRSGERRRCQWAGGYCTRYVSGEYCHEHEASRYGVSS